MKSLYVTLFVLIISISSNAQVNQIKSASSSHSSGAVSGGYSGDSYNSAGSGFVADLIFNVMFGQVIQAQQQKLQRRHDVPTMVSFDLMVQAGAQPSVYYIVQPRIRANWALFSTDFRFNYLIEEDIDGPKHIRTNDWQILQLNLITTRTVTGRIGGGFIQEAYGGRNGFPEWTAAFTYQPHASRFGGMAEYRAANPRKEINGFLQYRIFDQRVVHGFATAGVVYQRYYQSITTWGMQAGLMLKIY
jgi:hypothetical protein